MRQAAVRLSGQLEQDLSQHGSVQGLLRREVAAAGAGEQALRNHIVHRAVIPCAGRDILIIGGGGGGKLVEQIEVVAQLIVRVVAGGVVVHSDHIEDGVGGGLDSGHAGDVAGAAAGGAVLNGGLAPLEQAGGGKGVGRSSC